MRTLVLSSRFPWPPYSGDRLRATMWISALARESEVTLIAPAGVVPDDGPPVRFHPLQRSLASAARGAARVMRDGLPLQSLLAAPYRWGEAIAAARAEGAFDLTIVLLSRLDPWVRPSLNGERCVLDAIDSLRQNAHERMRSAGAATRWLWQHEEKRLARAESGLSHVYERVLVVNAAESAGFGDRTMTIPSGVPIRPCQEKPRRYDFGFWGRLAYFANADAAEWLLDEIWPLIRASRPPSTLAIAGAYASSRLRRKARRAGVTLLSPVDDVPALAREVRVALLPLRFGSGESNKTMEAAEGGCAIVGTVRAFRGVEPLAAHAELASSARELADAAVALAGDEPRRRAMAAGLRDAVTLQFARETALDRLAAVAMGREM